MPFKTKWDTAATVVVKRKPAPAVVAKKKFVSTPPHAAPQKPTAAPTPPAVAPKKPGAVKAQPMPEFVGPSKREWAKAARQEAFTLVTGKWPHVFPRDRD